jgi:hypothetical protein
MQDTFIQLAGWFVLYSPIVLIALVMGTAILAQVMPALASKASIER